MPKLGARALRYRARGWYNDRHMSSSGNTAPSTANAYPPRIQALRDDMIGLVPRVPNNKKTLALVHAMPTHRLMLAFVTWRMRNIPAKPRFVRIWGAVSKAELDAARSDLEPFLRKVAAGEDINGRLSELARTSGLIFPGAREAAKRSDIDTFLVRYGLYHFHLGTKHALNPRGRSKRLLFADVLENEFRVIALSSHKAFDRGDPEHMRLFRIAHGYVGRDVLPGQGFMTNPVMASGHALNVVGFSDHCDDRMRAIDPLLDDLGYVATLYADGKPALNGEPIPMPKRPKLKWCFHDLEFGILDETTGVFFCVSPYFKR